MQVLAEQEDGGGPAPRVLLSRALPVAEQIVGALRAHPGADRVEVAGCAAAHGRLGQGHRHHRHRRTTRTRWSPRCASCRSSSPSQSTGDAGARVTTHTGMEVDLKVVEPDQFGNVLQHFTGSKAHNVALREAAVRTRPARVRVRDPRRRHRARRCAARPRRRSTRRSATTGSRRSCARAAASWRRRARRDAARAGRRSRTCAATCTATRPRPTAARPSRRWPRRRWSAGCEYLAITDHSASHGFGNHVTAEELRAQHRARSARSTTRSTASSC